MPIESADRRCRGQRPPRSQFPFVSFLTSAILSAGLLAAWAAAASAQTAPEPLKPEQTLVVILTPRGFQGSPITIEAGRTFFSVQNRTFFSDITLQLVRLAEESTPRSTVRSVPLQNTRRTWRETVELTPGEYKLRVVENSAWEIALTVVVKGQLGG